MGKKLAEGIFTSFLDVTRNQGEFLMKLNKVGALCRKIEDAIFALKWTL